LKAHRNSNNNITGIVEKISMIWIQWHHQYHKKYLEETKEDYQHDQSGPHKLSKGKWASTPMDDPYDPLRASLVTLLGVVAFISSRSFQRYRLYYHWSFSVSPISLFFFFHLFHFFIVNCIRLFYHLRKFHTTLMIHKLLMSYVIL